MRAHDEGAVSLLTTPCFGSLENCRVRRSPIQHGRRDLGSLHAIPLFDWGVLR